MSSPLSLDDNLLSAANLQDPFPLYAQLRADSPVHWNGRFGSWFLTRYVDVRQAMSDVRRFSSDAGRPLQARTTDWPEAAQRHFRIGYRFFYEQMQALDPPLHTAFRDMVAYSFAPSVLNRWQNSIQLRVDKLITDCLHAGTFDFVADFAYPLPSLIIFDLIGIPPELHTVIRQSAAAFARFPPAVQTAQFHELESIAGDLQATEEALLELIKYKRCHPADDLLSSLVQGQLGSSPLSDPDIVVFCNFLLFAGHETTANLLGNSLFHLLKERKRWEWIQANPDRLPQVIEELLRFVSPVLTTSRLITEDVCLHGIHMRAGDRVQLGIGSANHDSAEFPNGDDLHLDRVKPHSVAFGHGIHYCIGAALARLEAQTALASLLTRMSDLILVSDEVAYHSVFFLRSLQTLLVTCA